MNSSGTICFGDALWELNQNIKAQSQLGLQNQLEDYWIR
jgi:hypothetical protein